MSLTRRAVSWPPSNRACRTLRSISLDRREQFDCRGDPRDIDPVLVDGMKALDLNGRLAKRTSVSASIHSVMLEFDIRWAGRTYRNLARWCRDFPD